MPNDLEGLQFFTRVGVGSQVWSLMLDGGSGVNSITEEIVVSILNQNQQAGIRLNQEEHPIKALEKWEKGESLRGVKAGAPIPLLGSVVLALTMKKLGSNTGPTVIARFKIWPQGSTDWVGMILGGRALDCQERGGLGSVSYTHLTLPTKRIV